jgi:hypothetical protein
LIRVIRSNKGREVTADQIGVAKMSKRADLHPRANSKTRAKTSAVAMVQPVTLFSSPVLLAGEDDAAFHELLSRVRTAINPVNIIDESGGIGMGDFALAPLEVEFDANART